MMEHGRPGTFTHGPDAGAAGRSAGHGLDGRTARRGATYGPAPGGAVHVDAAVPAAEEREAAAAAARTRAARPPRAGTLPRPGTATRAVPSGNDRLRELPTRDLVTELARKASALARKEVELAKAEVKADLRSEIKMASGLGVAGLCAIFTVQLLLTAIVFALFESGLLPGWAAALVVAAVVLAAGTAIGLWGWAKRVRKPLDTTRRSLRENARWAKEQIA